jgi:predicted nucleic acid-binding protein
MAEFVAAVRRKSTPRMREAELDRWLERLGRLVKTPVDAALVRRGVAISRRFRITYYDGAILAAAERLGCETLYSEDLSDGQTYGRVRVENPFRGL